MPRGSIADKIVPTTNTRNATRSDHSGPIAARPAPIGVAIATPATPASEIREFALTSEICGGSTRGTHAERDSTYAFEAISTPNAAG